jgi:hypothetical protein
MLATLRRLLPGFLLLGCAAAVAAPVPPPPPRTTPDPETVKRVQARQQSLLRLSEELHLASLGPARPIPEALRERGDAALADWKRDLVSTDDYVQREAVRDFENGYLRNFPENKVVEALLPLLKKPEQKSLERITAQGLLMEALTRHPAAAKPALPDLLAFVADDKVHTYLRSIAIDAVARLAPGDPAVVKTFIRALENPNPKDSSGVHDRIAERLGDMGKPAREARPALEKLFARGPWYGDVAYLALGKLARDESPRPLQAYLDRLGKIADHPQDEIAAAFLHIQTICHPGSPLIGPNTYHVFTYEKLDKAQAEKARPVLWKVADEHRDDVHARAALRTLLALRPGSSAEAARILTRNLEIKATPENGGRLADLSTWLLAQFEASDPAAIPILAESFGRQFANRNLYTIPRQLADLLASYGKQAKPVAPHVIRAVREFVVDPDPGSAIGELFGSYVHLLAALGSETPGAQALILDLLDPKSTILSRARGAAPLYHFELLRGLLALDLPARGPERDRALNRVRDALDAGSAPVFGMGARLVAKDAAALTEAELKPLLPLLIRVLAPDFKFRDALSARSIRMGDAFDSTQQQHLGPTVALQALAALGPKAKDAMPAVKAIADRPLKEQKRDSFVPEPNDNALIQTARKALQAIGGGEKDR